MNSINEIEDGLLADAPGLWCQQLGLPVPEGTSPPALFLDRDGVIVEEIEYLHRVEDVKLIAGVEKIIAACNENNLPVVLVTNQSGIGRGLYGWREFAAVQDRIMETLSSLGARIDMVLACAYHDQALSPYNSDGHSWRKPNPGMLMAAAERMKINLSLSWIVGDQPSDIEAGRAAKLAGGILVLSGRTSQSASAAVRSSGGYRVRVTYSLAACRFLLEYMKATEITLGNGPGSRSVRAATDRKAHN